MAAFRQVKSYKQGAVIRCRNVFRAPDINGALQPVDPTDVFFVWEDGAGAVRVEQYNVAPSQIVRVGVGDYYRDLDASAGGVWYYRFEGTGANQGADQHKFIVEPARPVRP